jgi:hypothetical protein
MGINGESTKRIQQVYVPIGSVLTTIIALMSFWIAFSNQLNNNFEVLQRDIRTIREVIVEHHGQLPK